MGRVCIGICNLSHIKVEVYVNELSDIKFPSLEVCCTRSELYLYGQVALARIFGAKSLKLQLVDRGYVYD